MPFGRRNFNQTMEIVAIIKIKPCKHRLPTIIHKVFHMLNDYHLQTQAILYRQFLFRSPFNLRYHNLLNDNHRFRRRHRRLPVIHRRYQTTNNNNRKHNNLTPVFHTPRYIPEIKTRIFSYMTTIFK